MIAARRRAIFLDRDGVLLESTVVNGRPRPAQSAADGKILPGVPEACRALRSSGFVLIVVTNQPDVARGLVTEEAVTAVNDALLAAVELDDVLMCVHDDTDKCSCRKPAPGLLVTAANRWSIDLGVSVMVGDRWRDIAAGKAAGCHTIFVDRAYRERRPAGQDLTVSSFPEAVPWIMARLGTEEVNAPCPLT
jgi:D-glycero-D-manno-heptose 1,7-bisphosphate phosphatase